MNPVRFFSLAGFLLANGTLLGAAADPAADATAWIGHDPSDKVSGVASLFDLPPVRRQLAALLGKADLKTVKDTYSVETPVTAVDGFVIASVCMPHDCDARAATVVIDPKTNGVAVGFLTDDAGSKADQRQRRIFSSFDIARLPDPVARRLLTIAEPAPEPEPAP